MGGYQDLFFRASIWWLNLSLFSSNWSCFSRSRSTTSDGALLTKPSLASFAMARSSSSSTFLRRLARRSISSPGSTPLSHERYASAPSTTARIENCSPGTSPENSTPVSYTHLRAHETRHDLVCRLLLEKKKN